MAKSVDMENNNSDYLERTNGGSSFTGGDQDIFRAALLAGSIKVYAKTGLLPTRGMSATKMLKLASQFTGKKYKRGEFENAQTDLYAHVKFLKNHPNTEKPLPRFPTD